MTGDLRWQPDSQLVATSGLAKFTSWLTREHQLEFSSYAALHSWSCQRYEDFWKVLLEYFDIQYDGSYKTVTNNQPMPHTRWFEGLQLNYAEHLFRQATPDQPAMVWASERGESRVITWAEMRESTGKLQRFFKSAGLTTGDRVAAYLPCIPEATIAMVAATGLGAVWASVSPDFGVAAVVDRFAQIEAKILIATTTYTYNGRQISRMQEIRELLRLLPTVQTVILIGEPESDFSAKKWHEIMDSPAETPVFVRVDFSSPLWILYSSGTTGLPKAITHSHGGILLEQFKYGAFHQDIRPGERCFWYTTTGWMMWNYQHSVWLSGGVMVMYDGSPAWPDLQVLWKFAEASGITHFGTSAGFIMACRKAGIEPAPNGLPALRSVSSTGSPLPAEGFSWIYEMLGSIWLISMSGGTDVCSAFVGGNPALPVYEGEIQCIALGCALESWDESGNPQIDQVGEMVITCPMPSMPITFWGDPEKRRYLESYFEHFPGVWRHGDWTTVTSRGTVIIQGRSDATLNRGGVRIGTAEIYRVLDKFPEVADSLVVGLELPGGKFWMPLFVQLAKGAELTEELQEQIRRRLRQDFSPRHVPDEILAVPEIPYTLSGKKTETPVKKILGGADLTTVVAAGALRNPASLDTFRQIFESRKHKEL